MQAKQQPTETPSHPVDGESQRRQSLADASPSVASSPSAISRLRWVWSFLRPQVLHALEIWRGDKITPVRLASHLALLAMAAVVLVLSRVQLPAWDLVRIVPVQAAPQAQADPQALTVALQAVGGSPLQESGVLVRAPVPFTQIPDRPRTEVITYTVQLNDTVLGIAEHFKINPNTVVWANLDDLNNPFVMEVGQVLHIPPVDGVLHTVEEGDTVADIAKAYDASADEIVAYAPNQLTGADAALAVGAVIIVPNGERKLPPPPQPVVPAPAASGGTGTSAPWRAAGFVWPTYGTMTQRYWLPAHPAIDLGASTGTTVVAADEGTVITAGWSTVGYGYHIIISHPDGFSTLYAHLSQISVSYGDYVARGQRIGAVGSTGRSTGPHLHFEVRAPNGRTYNPLVYLP